jgi:ketosteroid isomerase-like protein
MQKLLVTIAMLVVTAGIVTAQPKSISEQKIIAIDGQWAEAVARNNAAMLDRIFANDIIAISANGVYKTKQELTAEVIPPPELVIDEFSVSGVKTRVLGSSVVTTGEATLNVHAQGRPTTNHFLYTHVYAKRSGRWQIVNLQMTRTQSK